MSTPAMVNGSVKHRRARRTRAWLLGLGVGCGAMAFAAPAEAYIYMSDDSDNTIARATLDGQQVNYTFIQGVSNPGQVVVDANHIYWFNRGDGAIGRANLDGSGVNPDFIPSAAAVGTGISVGSGYIYWTDFQNSTLGRANMDGTGATTITTDLLNPEGVVVEGNYVYWTNYLEENGQVPIGRANLDGTGPVNDFILAPANQTGKIGQIVADSAYLYWGHGPDIARATLDGANVNTAFAVAPGGNRGLAVDSSYFYWSTNGDYNSAQPVARANVDGTGVNSAFIDNQKLLGGIAVDALVPPPSGTGTGTGTGTSTGTGTGTGTSTGAQSKCVVPRLRGKTLGNARKALARAKCALGKVTRPRKPTHAPAKGTKRILVVKSESPGAGSARPAGTRVSVRMVYKTVKVSRGT